MIYKTISFINGPNLNTLGSREPLIYGTATLDEINAGLKILAEKFCFVPDFFQSNSEGGIIDYIQSITGKCHGIIINPGAYAHYSVAIRDAISASGIPAVEVHLSNIYKREEFRQKSLTAGVCEGCITGLGALGYELALIYFYNKYNINNHACHVGGFQIPKGRAACV